MLKLFSAKKTAMTVIKYLSGTEDELNQRNSFNRNTQKRHTMLPKHMISFFLSSRLIFTYCITKPAAKPITLFGSYTARSPFSHP